MLSSADRVSVIVEGAKRKEVFITTPEGVNLNVLLAGRSERIYAFFLDMLLCGLIYGCIFLFSLFVLPFSFNVNWTIFQFFSFLVMNFYFIYFELVWQGRTPGKKAADIRVIDRKGEALKPSAIFARNLTRDIEFFIPLKLFLSIGFGGGWVNLVYLGWIGSLLLVPFFFNKQNLRVGDLIAGTMVVAIPKRYLNEDLADEGALIFSSLENVYHFSQKQLLCYGAFELQVLEEVLRKAPSLDRRSLLEQVCAKICKKIEWDGEPPLWDAHNFLTQFYAAERGMLEREKLFGRFYEDKTSFLRSE